MDTHTHPVKYAISMLSLLIILSMEKITKYNLGGRSWMTSDEILLEYLFANAVEMSERPECEHELLLFVSDFSMISKCFPSF